MTVESIWGVYHADGGLIGELKYVAGALFKGQHCSLCDITHKVAWEKSEMKKLRNEADVPFHLVHLNERPDDLISYTNGKTPILVAKTDSGFITIASEDGYSPSEVDAIVEFVDNGGTAIILEDYGFAGTIAEAFGVRYSGYQKF